MKRALWFFVAIMCMAGFSSCGVREKSAGVFGETFGPPVEGVSWGMTPEEAVRALELSEDYIESDESGVAQIYCEELEIFGQNAEAFLVFDERYQMGLFSIMFCLDDYEQDVLVEILNNTYGEYTAVDSEGRPCQWESKTVGDLPEDIQERFRYIEVEYAAQMQENQIFSQETKWEALKKEPLVSVTLQNGVLNYYAQHMAGYLTYSDDTAYEEFHALLKNIAE